MFARKDIEHDILSDYRQYGRHMRLQQERVSPWPRVFVDKQEHDVDQNMALQLPARVSSKQYNRSCSWASDAPGTSSRSASIDMSRVGSHVVIEIEEAAQVVLRKLTHLEKGDLAETK